MMIYDEHDENNSHYNAKDAHWTFFQVRGEINVSESTYICLTVEVLHTRPLHDVRMWPDLVLCGSPRPDARACALSTHLIFRGGSITGYGAVWKVYRPDR